MGHLVGYGMDPTLRGLNGLTFDPSRPYTGCRICGTIYQNDSVEKRKLWTFRHAKTHSSIEHNMLALSGKWCTPDAAIKLASYGVIAMGDGAVSDDHYFALLESKPVPINDVEV